MKDLWSNIKAWLAGRFSTLETLSGVTMIVTSVFIIALDVFGVIAWVISVATFIIKFSVVISAIGLFGWGVRKTFRRG